VRALCANYPGAYWRELDAKRAYPEAFVNELTEAGYLAALVPEEFGGSGLPLAAGCAILEEIQKTGCNGAACHAQMYTMGTVLRHGNAAQKQRYLPGIAEGSLRLQAFGVTEPTSGTDTLSLQTTVVPQDDNQRPLVYINDVHADHPLYIEQRHGIPQAKLAKIYAGSLCSGSGTD